MTKKNRIKQNKQNENMNNIIRVFAVLMSTFLLALSTKLISLPIDNAKFPLDNVLESPMIYAAILAALSLPFLVSYIFLEPYEKELGFYKINAYIGSFGLVTGLLAYLCIVLSIHKYLLGVFLGSVIIISLMLTIPLFKGTKKT